MKQKFLLIILSLSFVFYSLISHAVNYCNVPTNTPETYIYRGYIWAKSTDGSEYKMPNCVNANGDLVDDSGNIVDSVWSMGPNHKKVFYTKKDFIRDPSFPPIKISICNGEISSVINENTGYTTWMARPRHIILDKMQLVTINREDALDDYLFVPRIDSKSADYKISALSMVLDDGYVIALPIFSFFGRHVNPSSSLIGNYHLSWNTFLATKDQMQTIANHAIQYRISSPNVHTYTVTKQDRVNWKAILNRNQS